MLLAASEIGRVLELARLKSFPVIFRSVTWTAAELWLVRVRLPSAVCPTVTLPNSTVSVEAWKEPIPVPAVTV